MGSSHSRTPRRVQQSPQYPPAQAPQTQPQVAYNRPPGSQVPPHLLRNQPPAFQAAHAPPAIMSQHQPAAQNSLAEVREAQTIANPCTVHRKSITFVDSKLSFTITSTVPCSYQIHVGVRDWFRKGTVIFTPNRPKPAPPVIHVDTPHDELVIETPVDLSDTTPQVREYLKQYPRQIPLAISLKYRNEAGLEMNELTYITLLPKPAVIKQLLSVSGTVYDVQSLFGGGEDEGAPTVAAEAPDASGNVSPGAGTCDAMLMSEEKECVICLTEQIDTAVIPCRHLCLCRRCADELRRQSPKCPVCRGPIEQLLTMHKVESTPPPQASPLSAHPGAAA